GHNLAEFDAPLIETVDVPDGALCEYRVFIQRDQLSERFRSQPLQQHCVRWTVTLEYSMRCQPVGNSFRLNLLGSLTERQGFSLSKNIGHQHGVMISNWIQRLGKRDEVA